MSRALKIGLGCLIVATVIALSIAGYLRHFAESPINFTQEPIDFEIMSGANLHRVATQLETEGLIDNRYQLILLARLNNVGDRILRGEYRLEPGLTVDGFLTKIISGDDVKRKLQIIEGWSFQQMLEYVHSLDDLQHKLTGIEIDAVMATLALPSTHPEGRFFPDTYVYSKGMTDIEVLQTAYWQMDRHLQREWQLRAENLPYKNPYEALIMASIVEKETGRSGERAEIAGVFVRRLQKGMRLQTDPTVIYGLGDAFDGDIKHRDLAAMTPYNTYRIDGLPPTPIAMPGLESIHAALHPASGDSLFFVSKGDGTHVFSSSYAAHQEAVKKYQLGGQ